MVRKLLNGRFANTAFCVFDPQGKRALSRSGRGPHDLVRGRGQGSDDAIIREMNRIVARFQPAKNESDFVLQDFDSFRQALNVASADQRLLIFLTSEDEALQQNLRTALNDEAMIGRFHVDFADAKTDKNWKSKIKGENSKKPGLLVVRSDKFGLSGVVMDQLPESSSSEEIFDALKTCNETFAASETRKSYSQHVSEGRRRGIYFENEIPYGEDRNGDGKPDRQNRRGNPRQRR